MIWLCEETSIKFKNDIITNSNLISIQQHGFINEPKEYIFDDFLHYDVSQFYTNIPRLKINFKELYLLLYTHVHKDKIPHILELLKKEDLI